MTDAFSALVRWMPFLLKSGFLFNVIISLFAMLIGTVMGIILGLGQISKNRIIRRFSWFITQLFRNSPWLVLLFIVLLAFPFEVTIFGIIIPIPDWMKAVIGLSLPIMANISEIVRGAVLSVPTAQWEAAESLAFSRQQILWRIILPQCFKRMIPPWMNWYAILTMATPLCSLLGVEEIITLSRQAMEAENNHPELLVPFYSFALVLFFFYCYPIARATMYLERRYSVKI
ncbi:MAG: amino acid ABC transporter permease, partial [Pseudomonadota bacterium]|nr:amino acid ABC transporter permease [Pseudomonadota bacterium]